VQQRDPDLVEPRAIGELVDLAGKRVIDVGCGDGRMTRFAAERALSVYAFDPNEERVEEARASLPAGLRGRVSFRIHGAEQLDLARRRFDVALCGWSL
jgi:2-polyprenyl-3-methyl-5-hydroxy-6-metoxy-1,4-benzoquinol methylase